MQETEQSLANCSHADLMALFTQLDAPAIDEMHGEYAARLLAQPTWLARQVGKVVLANPWQQWLCKAFRPVDADHGRGYNRFQVRGTTVQRYPMKTRIAPSRFDGRPAYQLVYRHFHSLCGDIHMVDEIRRVTPGLYLGLGTYGFTDAMRRIPYPFVLVGPQADYCGDIGRERKHFQPGARELPAPLTQ